MISVPELEGFEAWRVLCRHIDSGRAIRLDALRRRMRRPAPIRTLADVPQGVLRFSNLYREYREAGGEELPKESLKSDLCESLPAALRDQLLWHTISPEMSWDQFKDHVAGTAHRIMHYSNHSPVHLTDAMATGDLEARTVQIEQLLGQLRDLDYKVGADGKTPDVLAVGGKRLCANCGKSHPGPCKAPKVAPEERRCWNCQGTGHVRAQCPHAQATTGTAITSPLVSAFHQITLPGSRTSSGRWPANASIVSWAVHPSDTEMATWTTSPDAGGRLPLMR